MTGKFSHDEGRTQHTLMSMGAGTGTVTSPGDRETATGVAGLSLLRPGSRGGLELMLQAAGGTERKARVKRIR
jgi:hypothetical protein